METRTTILNFSRDEQGNIKAIGDAGIEKEIDYKDSLLAKVKNDDKEAIKGWEDRAGSGERVRIM